MNNSILTNCYLFMNFFYNTELDQLRCNFCNHWFSCGFHFANIQRYSLNACPNCIANFSYSVVDPQNFQIYEVLMINTGFSLGLSQITWQEKLDGIIRRHKNGKNMNLER
jgi:hypothetical protein